jgi:hypothetical protein
MSTIVQPSANPTNKLTAAVVGVAAINVVRVVVSNIWPAVTDDGFWMAMDPLAVFLAGWFVKDEANVATPVVVSTPETGEPA